MPAILNSTFDKAFSLARAFVDKYPGYERGAWGLLWPKHYQSPLCCGLMELTTVYQPTLSAEQRTWLKEKGYTGTGQDLVTADSIGRLGTSFLIYAGTKTVHRDFINILESFGFEKLTSFANSIHNYHELELWGCHNTNCTHAIKRGSVQWVNALGTTRARSVAAATT